MQQTKLARAFPPWVLLACLAAELIACPSLASWTLCAFSYRFESHLFQSSRIMRVFFSIWKFPANVQNILFSLSSKWCHLYFSFHDSWNFSVSLIGAACSRRCRCLVTLSILLSSEESVQWALNWFSFGHFSKLYFERKHRCHKGLETGKAIILNPAMHFISE